MRRLPLLLLPLSLAACGSGTPVSIDIKSDEGDNASITMDNGAVAIKGDKFEGNFRIPSIKMKAKDFDFDGVKLYPDSEIGNFHISALDRKGQANDEGRVTVDFTAPAALGKVQDWFRDQLTREGFKFSARDGGFAGTTKDGDPFTLDLAADGIDKAKGRIEFRGS